MILIRYRLIIFFMVVFIGIANADENIEVTTYYPAPRAAYGTVTVQPTAANTPESRLATAGEAPVGVLKQVLVGTASSSSTSKLFVNGDVGVGVHTPIEASLSKLKTNGGLQIERRTNDTVTDTGRIWLRTDLNDNGEKTP